MNPLFKHLIFISMMVCVSSCVTLYKPNSINSPVLKRQGDLKCSGGLGVSGSGLLNLQTAYGVTNHVGVMLNGMYHSIRTNEDSIYIGKHNQYFGEGGVGYFSSMGAKKNGVFQCFGGGGIGYTNDYFSQTDENHARSTATYFNYFIQPGIAYSNDFVDVSFDIRANDVNIFSIQSTSDFYNDTTFNFINLEPTFTIKAGGKKLKGFIQTGITYPIYHPDAYLTSNSFNLFLIGPIFKFSIGLNMTFNLSKQKTEPTVTPQ